MFNYFLIENTIMFSSNKNKTNYQYLAQLPKISQLVDDIDFFYTPSHFREIFLKKIANASHRICIVTLFLEQDEGGYSILNALYTAKRLKPELYINVIVDWHRAKRRRFGTSKSSSTNADWYYNNAKDNPDVDIPVLGVPINILEALGVLHFKCFIFDDSILYSGASINNDYLHKLNKYRYDRYHLIRNAKMSDIMFSWVEKNLIKSNNAYRLNDVKSTNKKNFKNKIRFFRNELYKTKFDFQGDANNEQLSVTPLVGLGKSNVLNKTIFHLIKCTNKKLIICTPYFNLPVILISNIIKLLRNGKNVEIILGDKTSNDFFISEDKPFKIISIIPYLYEINLRRFIIRLQYYINNNQLKIRIWKDKDNSYHLKGIWVDNNWILLTGNNLNSRAWNLDLENAILIHDPHHELILRSQYELNIIYTNTTIVNSYQDLQSISDYPTKIQIMIRHLRRIRIDRLINKVL